MFRCHLNISIELEIKITYIGIDIQYTSLDLIPNLTTHAHTINKTAKKENTFPWLFCGYNHTVTIHLSMAPRDKSLIKSKGRGFTPLWFPLISDHIIYIHTLLAHSLISL